MPNFCSNCGARLDPNAKFCSNCGNRVAAAIAPAPAPAVQEPAKVSVSTAGIEELQTELYSLYKILEPARELDGARRKVDAKLSEMRGHQSTANAQFYRDFVYFAPFIGPSITKKIDENTVTPTTKEEAKAWDAYVKRYKQYEKISTFDPFDEGKYNLIDIYRLFKQNEGKILRDKLLSWHYYKMCYVFEEPQSPEKYWVGYVCDDNGKHEVNDYKLINYQNFVTNYLPKKIKYGYDEYLMSFLRESFLYKGEYQLNDITRGYVYAPSIEAKNLCLYDSSLGFPKIQFMGSRGKTPYLQYDVMDTAKGRLKKDIPIKKECDDAVSALSLLKNKMDSAYSVYMQEVEAYINSKIKIVPMSYAHNWDTVAYFLYLIVNRRGRDIYEVINQYEIDMKHRELTSALTDIRSEIGNQTQVLAGKLDSVNRSVVQASDRITTALCAQTVILGEQLEKINYSVISTGASIAGQIANMGAAMGAALSNMHVKVSV